MSKITYSDIVSQVKATAPTFDVTYNPEEGECATVYPPKSYTSDYGIDVFIDDNGRSVSLWMEDSRVGNLKKSPDAETVIAEVIRLLEVVEKQILL